MEFHPLFGDTHSQNRAQEKHFLLPKKLNAQPFFLSPAQKKGETGLTAQFPPSVSQIYNKIPRNPNPDSQTLTIDKKIIL